MKHLKNYYIFIFENYTEMVEIFNDADILESIVTDSDELLKTINAEEVNLKTVFALKDDTLLEDFSIEDLFKNPIFNRNLKKMNYKKNEIESSVDSETFLEDAISIKFFTIHDIAGTTLEKPDYIIFQSKKKKNDKNLEEA